MYALARSEVTPDHSKSVLFEVEKKRRSNAKLLDQYVLQFARGVQLNTSFEADRFLMQSVNRRGELQRFSHLLSCEIDELFEAKPEGYWQDIDSNPEKKKAYLEQEISDVVIFALTGHMRLGTEADQSRIFAEAYQGHATERAPYLILSSIWEINQGLKLGSESITAVALDQLIILCARLAELVGFNLWAAVCEKCARNSIKYPAVTMKKPEPQVRELDENFDWGPHYRIASVICKTLFKSALNPHNYVKSSASVAAEFIVKAGRSEKKWKEAWGTDDKGTEEFYEIAREPQEILRTAVDFKIVNQALLAIAQANMIQ